MVGFGYEEPFQWFPSWSGPKPLNRLLGLQWLTITGLKPRCENENANRTSSKAILICQIRVYLWLFGNAEH